MKMTEPTQQRAWVDVDLTALANNARTIANRSRARLLPMLKANGYGLGAVRVSRALEALEPWGFGVATTAEGEELRVAGVTRPIVVFSPLVPAGLSACVEHDLRPSLGDIASLAAWIPNGRPFHLEIDTGMARAGLRWNDGAALADAARLLADAAGWEGVYTHFHSADSDPSATARQWDRFEMVLSALPSRPRLVHAANSAAALSGPRYAGDLVRPGIFLYGGCGGRGRTGAGGPAVCAGGGDASSAGRRHRELWRELGCTGASECRHARNRIRGRGAPDALQPRRHRGWRTAMPCHRTRHDGHDDDRVGCRDR